MILNADIEYLILPRPLSLQTPVWCHPVHPPPPFPDGGGGGGGEDPGWDEEGVQTSYVRLVRWWPAACPVHCWTLKHNILHYKTIFWPFSTKIYREPTWFLGLNFTWLISPPDSVNYQEIRSLSSLQSPQ